MEVPQLIRERLGDESVEGTVSLGDEDVVCVTPTRTFVYRGEGLLSDESVGVYSHDVEQFDVSEGRRKTKFVFEYVDRTESFTVPGDRTGTVLKLLLGGILHVADVTDDGESISDVFSFSELTLVVTSHRLVKHVGALVWDEDFEEFPYDDVTGLSFEEGSVATQVVLSVNGRPQRIKAPSDEARKVERALTQALFAYHDVDSLAEFNEAVGDDESGVPDASDSSESLSLDDDISPLVGESDTESSGTTAGETGSRGQSRSSSRTGSGTESRSGETSAADRSDTAVEGTTSVDTVSSSSSASERGPNDASSAVDPDDIETMKKQISTLTTAVKKQNELLRDQQETIEKLIEELRRGR